MPDVTKTLNPETFMVAPYPIEGLRVIISNDNDYDLKMVLPCPFGNDLANFTGLFTGIEPVLKANHELEMYCDDHGFWNVVRETSLE